VMLWPSPSIVIPLAATTRRSAAVDRNVIGEDVCSPRCRERAAVGDGG
jgi:hypothetical protein